MGEASLTLTPPSEGQRLHVWRALWELAHDLSVAVLFCFFLITFVAQAFRVQGTSMLPLLEDSERIIVNKFVYRFQPIERGDVVVFWYPKDPSVSFIKRVVGVPGDTVELRRGSLYVNARRVEEDYVRAQFNDGESYEAMTERVLDAVLGIARTHEGGRVLVVSHGGPIRAIHAAALGLDVHTYRRLRPVEPNARLSAVCYAEDAFTELCPANEIDALIERDQAERRSAAARPPTPAG